MDTIPGLTRLAARKRDLLIESDLNRQVLRIELDQVRLRCGKLRQSFGWMQSSWAWVVPVAGFFAGRKAGPAGDWLSKAAALMALAREAVAFWKSRRGTPPAR